MNANELIAKLKELPDNKRVLPVCFTDYESGNWEITEIEFYEDAGNWAGDIGPAMILK